MAYNLFLRMYTEQDTFNRLRRIPIQEMRLKVRAMNRAEKPVRYVRAALKRFGWTASEYQAELAKVIK
jgi:hypothetical protein